MFHTTLPLSLPATRLLKPRNAERSDLLAEGDKNFYFADSMIFTVLTPQ